MTAPRFRTLRGEVAPPRRQGADGPTRGEVRPGDALTGPLSPERGYAPRQFMFARGEFVVHIQLDESKRGSIRLVGQIMLRGSGCLRVPIELRRGKKQCATLTDSSGEFQFETRNSADPPKLVVMFPDSQVIEIPLESLFAQP